MSRSVFMFSVVLPFQRYSTLFVTLECFAHKKRYLFFLCNISSLCAISYVPMVAIYVYQLNIWLIFKSMWLNSMFISHEDVGCLYLHLKLQLGGEPIGPAARRVEEFPSVHLHRLLEGQLHDGVCFGHVKLKRFIWILQFSFKLKTVLQSDPHDRRVVNCLQWLLCVALCFRRSMNCLTKTGLNDLTKNVFS